MKISSFHAVLAPVLGLGLSAGLWAKTPSPIPLESFFNEPDCRAMELSPDGKQAAFLTTLGYGKVGVALLQIATGKYEPLVSARDENIKGFLWKGNDYIIYHGDIGGDESPAWRSIPIVPPKPGAPRRVVALSEAYLERYNERANFMQVIDPLPYDPLHVLAYGRRGTGSSTFGMFLVDVRDGRRTTVDNYRPVSTDAYLARINTQDIADNHGRLRARTRIDGTKAILEIRPDPEGPYVQVADYPADHVAWALQFFAADDETLYFLDTEKSDTSTLRSINIRTRQLSPAIFHAPDGEIDELITSWDRSTLYGVTYITDQRHTHFFDDGQAKLQQMIDGALPNTCNNIVSTSQDEKIQLILASSDCDPGTYYVLDRVQRSMKVAGRVFASINPAQMRPMESISFTARDGLAIHGYLTRPAVADGRRLPLIIHPHGGPYGIRDDWGFNREVQFLASRGYAVLQVNYRGSGGYGAKFERAGYHEWGGKMQDDLSDAVKWAIDQGIADPARVAIYGASYGGYAALAGLVYTPELYCCGANYVGPSDLGILVGLGKIHNSDSANFFYSHMVGDDRSYLEARSPVNFIERLRVPLFNAYGYNDPRVDFRHWTRLEAKLKQFNKPYEIIIEDNEGHGFQNEKNRLAYYRRLEAFFERYLAPVPMGQAGAQLPVLPAKSGN
jgi:dipeptidyl aminopeptidase/acylaminoacyl peptidase